MKFNKWTVGLAAVGVVSLASAARADETKMEQVQTSLSNTTLSGYVDTSAMWNTGTQNGAALGNSEGGQLPPYTPGGTHGDGFNMNAVDIALDKPLDESPWAAGYHVEMMLGQDSVGIPLSYSGGSTSTTGNGSAIRQAYLALRTPVGNSAIDWKMGVWDSPIGYESSSDPLNPNFTRSYGWFIEPTTFTGLLGSYKVNDEISFSAGVANAQTGNASDGNDPNFGGVTGVPYESQKAYMAGITLTAPDSWGWMKGATLNSGVIVADNGSAPSGKGATWLYVGGVIPTPLEKLKVGAAFDYVDFHDANTRPPGPGINPANDSIWVAGVYASYQATDKLSFNVRGENYAATASGSSTGVPAQGHNVQELTGTVQYKLWENVLSRLEVRWDHAPGKAWDNGSSLQSNGEYGPVHKNEVLLAANLIYQF